MWTLLVAEVIGYFRRMWKLYLVNSVALLFIIVLFAYRDGAFRQFMWQKSVFSGDVVVRVVRDVPLSQDEIVDMLARLPYARYAVRKLRSVLEYRVPGGGVTGQAEVIGVEWERDHFLREFVVLREGYMPTNDREILIPISLQERDGIATGDTIRLTGQTYDGVHNSSLFRVAGVYNFAEFALFYQPKILLRYTAMEMLVRPSVYNVEYCLFFEEGKRPRDYTEAYALVMDGLGENSKHVASFESYQIDILNLMDMPMQFHAFFVVIMAFSIFMVLSFVMLVNFNVALMMFRYKQVLMGTLRALGVPVWKSALMLYLEFVAQIVISLGIASVLAWIGSLIMGRMVWGGTMEVLLLLMAGTNRVDLYIQPYQIGLAFGLVWLVVTLSQVPLLLKMVRSAPTALLRKV